MGGRLLGGGAAEMVSAIGIVPVLALPFDVEWECTSVLSALRVNFARRHT